MIAARPISALDMAHRLAPHFDLTPNETKALGQLLAAGPAGVDPELLPGPMRKTSQVHICRLRAALGEDFPIVSRHREGPERRTKPPIAAYALSAESIAELKEMAREAPWRPPAKLKLRPQEEVIVQALAAANPTHGLSSRALHDALIAAGSTAEPKLVDILFWSLRKKLGADSVLRERTTGGIYAWARTRLSDEGRRRLGLPERAPAAAPGR